MEGETNRPSCQERSKAQGTQEGVKLAIDIVSLFPGYFTSPLQETIVGRAQRNGLVTIRTTDLRQFGEGRHRQVDDEPYGGGPGMVLMPGSVVQALDSVAKESSTVVHLSPQGTPLTSKVCQRLAQKGHLVLLCGHYEGIDQRVMDNHVDEEVSIGDYVLTNGCVAALVLLDAVIRFVPGVLKEQAREEESFTRGLFDWPHFTRPPHFEGVEVPDTLRKGNHRAIRKWRFQKALEKTEAVRPDLVAHYIQEEGSDQKRVQTILRVADLQRAMRFYQRTLKLQVEPIDASRARICLPEASIQLIEVEPLERQWIQLQLAGTKQEFRGCDPDGHYWVIEDLGG